MASRPHDLVSAPAALGAILLVSACAKLGHGAGRGGIALRVVRRRALSDRAATPWPTSAFLLARCAGGAGGHGIRLKRWEFVTPVRKLVASVLAPQPPGDRSRPA